MNSANGDAPEMAAPKTTVSKKGGQQSIEKTYQKKSQLEHILLRPDTYIGSVEKVTEQMWIFDSATEKIEQKEITYVPGLYKIFDEILVNAADNKQRDPSMNTIKIDINQELNMISVWNNGKGIPVVEHKDEKVYVPTMIFGELLTSSNYNDEEEKVTGGRNGYGAKLCNIFSTKFTVETSSKEYKKAFKQTWTDNMGKSGDPKIKPGAGEDYTKVVFCPDLTKFKMQALDDDIVALMSRRAYDVAASTGGVKVFLNGKRVPIKNFKEYIDLFLKGYDEDKPKVCHEIVNNRWEIAVALSNKGFQQMSFVNSIATTKGGRHVDYVTDQIVKQVIDVVKKKNKGGISVKPFQVKSHMWVFVNCLIVNPTFDSQTKENMTLQTKNFGSKCVLSEKFILQVSKSGIIESVLTWAKFKAENDLAKHQKGKKQQKLKGIAKLEDANEAGGKNAYRCTLILTEGDSAKTLVVSGFAVIGRDYYGVFPLRGKLLNVREATHKQILENVEINNIIKILGLQYKKKYLTQDDVKTLRYGKLMIMTDQDQDGSHIKGLLINFIHTNWPELLKLNFLEEFITPIVKVSKRNEELSFYSLPEFEEWKSDTPNHNTYKVKYYKGLGTSTSNEAKAYFQDMARHQIKFRYDGPQDDHSIVMAFSKKCVDQRKDWLTNHMEECRRRKEFSLAEQYLYNKNTRDISYTQFINLELVLFSNADNIRSIPSIVDGFKPGQRKVLFTCMKRNDKREVKVAQLSGAVAELSAYHHGEVSLQGTIINLAQNYVGSNNINLLMPNGQFGTRLVGGKDSASPRYIFTMMSELTRLIFHPHDDPLLTYEYDDNLKIEPVWYIPIIPMVLVNGADGIGTGWMTKIPNHNPRDLVRNIRKMLDGDEPDPMLPWYKNFKGTIENCGDHRFVVSGEISIIDDDKVEITELPIGTWTQNYKENVLEPLLHGNEKTKPILSDYKEYNTDTTVRMVLTLLPGQMANCEKEGFHKVFKLQSMINTSSMCGFDDLGCLRRYDNVSIILREFYALRLTMYGKRKDYLEGMLNAEANKLSDQARFIKEKCDGTLTVENKKRKVIVDELIKRGYKPDPVKKWRQEQTGKEDEEEEAENEPKETEEEDDDDAAGTSKKPKKEVDPEKEFLKSKDVKNFDYLLGMQMWMLTREKKEELLRQAEKKRLELEALREKTPADLWRADLDAFMKKLDIVEEKERKDELAAMKKIKAGKSKGAGGGRKKVNLDDTLPTTGGERVIPVIGEEVLKKVANANRAKEQKKKIKKESFDVGSTDEKDELDLLLDENKKTLTAKLGETPEMIEKKAKAKREKKPKGDGLKQTKLTFKQKSECNDGSPKKKGRKANAFTDSEDESAVVLSGSDVEMNVKVAPREKTAGRRAATAKVVKYNLDSDEDEDKVSSDSDLPVGRPVAKKDNNYKSQAVHGSDSDSDVSMQKTPPKKESAESMFDSLVMNKSSEESPTSSVFSKPVTTQPVEKRKRPTPPKQVSGYSSSDSDDDLRSVATKEAPSKKTAPKKKTAVAKPRKPAPKKMKKNTSSEDDSDYIVDVSPEAKPSTRVRKPAKYNFGESDESE